MYTAREGGESDRPADHRDSSQWSDTVGSAQSDWPTQTAMSQNRVPAGAKRTARWLVNRPQRQILAESETSQAVSDRQLRQWCLLLLLSCVDLEWWLT